MDLVSDIEKGLKQLDDELVSLRMETFTGQYDENNAILTLHAVREKQAQVGLDADAHVFQMAQKKDMKLR